jgi:2-polyprenyl-3-methyl-5-hydroxy-6-metoxy-1,4-benzoquinol methylase
LMSDAAPVELGAYVTYQLEHSPRRILHALSYYKFAAKMLGPGAVLDVGCNEGLGTWLLAKECGRATGIDFDEPAVAVARRNWTDPSIDFITGDFHVTPLAGPYAGIVSFDVIEHIDPSAADAFLARIAAHLQEDGVAIIGTPNATSSRYASAITNAGHINMYEGEALRSALLTHFRHVFMFGANDELVHTGYLPMAHYLIGVCYGRRALGPP